jgi:hypothetical protein
LQTICYDKKVDGEDVAQRKECVAWIERWTSVGLLGEQLECDAELDAGALRERARDDVQRYARTRRWALAYEHREAPQAGDTLLLLAARRLLRVARLASSPAAARADRVRAVSLLVAALHLSPHNFELRTQLCIAYGA